MVSMFSTRRVGNNVKKGMKQISCFFWSPDLFVLNAKFPWRMFETLDRIDRGRIDVKISATQVLLRPARTHQPETS
jgi:hypothetical protein